MPTIEKLLISSSPEAPMQSVSEVVVEAGLGIRGDRYHLGKGTFSPTPRKPDFEITFIEAEAVESFLQESGLPFTVEQARRNVVTRGVRLNDLVGREFSAGSQRFLGIRLCEPCNYLAKTTLPEVLKGLVHRGGLRAQILTSGVIRVGDLVRTGS